MGVRIFFLKLIQHVGADTLLTLVRAILLGKKEINRYVYQIILLRVTVVHKKTDKVKSAHEPWHEIHQTQTITHSC